MEKKVLAKIQDVFYGIEDRGIFTCYIRLNMGGVTQSFGSLFLDKENKGPDYYRSLCSLFAVRELKELVGKQCFALYCFGNNNETIEGIETMGGFRFTLTKFSRKYYKDVKTPLEKREEHLRTEIDQLQDRIKSNRSALKNLKKTYTDWEKK